MNNHVVLLTTCNLLYLHFNHDNWNKIGQTSSKLHANGRKLCRRNLFANNLYNQFKKVYLIFIRNKDKKVITTSILSFELIIKKVEFWKEYHLWFLIRDVGIFNKMTSSRGPSNNLVLRVVGRKIGQVSFGSNKFFKFFSDCIANFFWFKWSFTFA